MKYISILGFFILFLIATLLPDYVVITVAFIVLHSALIGRAEELLSIIAITFLMASVMSIFIELTIVNLSCLALFVQFLVVPLIKSPKIPDIVVKINL
jgi:hypothetical protein